MIYLSIHLSIYIIYRIQGALSRGAYGCEKSKNLFPLLSSKIWVLVPKYVTLGTIISNLI